MTGLRRARAWLDAPVPHSERAHYPLGHAEPDGSWRRASRLDTWRISAARRRPSPEKWLYSLGVRRADTLALPDLLCIGAQKAATSWLHANLARHPDAYLPPGAKELHYFDFSFREPLAAYAELFAAGTGKVKCDVTPNYGRLRASRIRFVRRVMPDARLVFLLRHPLERAWSQAVMDVATRAGRDVAEVTHDEWLAHLRAPASLRNGRYTQILDAWLRHFPAEQLFVGFFDEVREQPRELLARIFRHAGLDPEVDAAYASARERVAAGPGVAIPADLRAEVAPLFADEVQRIAARFGGPARRWSP